MRVVVTGAGNPVGEAITHELLKQGHSLRLFGIDAETAAKFGDVQWYPGSIATIGSIEPVLAEREVLVHAACLDAPGKDKVAHALHIERGTIGARYGAERELLELFIHVTPATTGRFAQAHERSVETAKAARKVPVEVITAAEPTQAAVAVADAIAKLSPMGRYPGRESDALVL